MPVTTLVFWVKYGHPKTFNPLNLKVLEFISNILQAFSPVRCTECQILITAQEYSSQLYIILATNSQY